MIYIGIGSNLLGLKKETPIQNCKKAILLIKKKIKIVSVSSWYESEPIPISNHPWYINAVIEINTKKKPIELLNFLLRIEKRFGRTRKKKNESRIIDLDILDYKNIPINYKNKLVIPHPRMHKRAFVLLPLKEINSKWKHPISKITISKLINNLEKKQKIKKIK